jgi:hypothetical protein
MRRVISSIKLYVLVLTTILFLCGPVTSYGFSFFGGGFGGGFGSGSSSKTPTVNPASLPGVKLSSAQDTYIDQRKANNSFGTNSNILLSSRSRQVKQGLMKFNISGVPKGAIVTKAKLWVYVAKKGGSRSSISVYEAMGAWSRTTTWSKKPQMSGSSKGSVSVSKAGDYYAVDVTSLVQDWADGSEENNGIYIVTKSGEIYVNSAENKKYKPVLTVEHKPRPEAPSPVPTPVPTPTPTTPPGPVPTPAPGTIKAGDKVVASGQSIQSAIDGASSGQTVWVKSGTWVLNSQLVMKRGVSVKAYPGMEAYDWETDTINPSHPYIIPGTCDFCSIRWNTNQGNNEFSGFEVAGGYSGIDIHADNVIVTNNWVHDTTYTSIFIASSSNILVEHNKTERDGQECDGWPNPVDGTQISPRHCHSVYLSNVLGYCGMSNVTIRENYLSDSGGSAVNFNGDACANAGEQPISNTLIELNKIVDVNVGPALWHGTTGTVIRDNAFTIRNPYTPPDSTNDLPVGMKCGIVAWDETPAMSGNTFDLRSDYKQFCQY